MTEGNKYEKGTLGWIREQAKKDGFGDNIGGWQNWKNKKKREQEKRKEEQKRKQEWYKELEDKYGNEFADWAMKNKGHIPIWWINAGCKTRMEYHNKLTQKKLKDQARKDGFDNVDDWSKWKKDQNWHDYLKNRYGKDFADWAMKNKDRVPTWWINTGCKTITEYNNKCAQDAGFKDFNERQREWRHETGKSIPYEFNEYCSSHVGVTIGEDVVGKPILDMMFEEVVKKGYGNSGYEFLCKNPRKEFLNRYPRFILESRLERDKEYKVDVKTRHFLEGRWVYKIDYNNTADFFMIIGLGTIDDIPEFVLLIHKDDIIRGIKFWKRTGICIGKSHSSEFKMYELKDELGRFQKMMNDGIEKEG